MTISIRDVVKHAKKRTLPDILDRSWAKYHKRDNPVAEAITYLEAKDWRRDTSIFWFPLLVIMVLVTIVLVGQAFETLSSTGDFGFVTTAVPTVFAALLLFGCIMLSVYLLVGWRRKQGKETVEKFIVDLERLMYMSDYWYTPGLSSLSPLCSLSEVQLKEKAKEILIMHAYHVTKFQDEFAGNKNGPDFQVKKGVLMAEMKSKFDLLLSLGLVSKGRNQKDPYKRYFKWAREKVETETGEKEKTAA